MFTHVHNVIVANSYATLDEEVSLGPQVIGIFDADGHRVKTVADLETAKSPLRFTVGREAKYAKNHEGRLDVLVTHEKSFVIPAKCKGKLNYGPVEDGEVMSIALAFDGDSLTEEDLGRTVVLRIVYKDLAPYGEGRQVVTEYQQVITEVGGSLYLEQLGNSVKNDPNARVSISNAPNQITLYAESQVLNIINIDSEGYINVNFDASLMISPKIPTINGTYEKFTTQVVKAPYVLPKYFSPQVLVNERKYLGYKGQIDSDCYPHVVGKTYTEPGATYHWLTLEYNAPYRSNDNQYIKDTPLTIEVYLKVDLDNDNSGDITTMGEILDRWINYGNEPLPTPGP